MAWDLDPFMEALDFPDLGMLAPERGESVSALSLLHSLTMTLFPPLQYQSSESFREPGNG